MLIVSAVAGGQAFMAQKAGNTQSARKCISPQKACIYDSKGQETTLKALNNLNVRFKPHELQKKSKW